MEEKELEFKYGIDEKPSSKLEHSILSLQHVFAMFGSTILVPTLIGLDPSIAIFCAGLGTLIYSFTTRGKVPVFIGSSFAYISILLALYSQYGAVGVANGVISVGIIYILIALLIKLVGTNWVDKLLPPIVIGPIIMVIGLGLATTAVENSGFLFGSEGYSHVSQIIAILTLLITVLALLYGNKTIKSIPVLIGILGGYLVAIVANVFQPGTIDLSWISDVSLIQIPPFETINILSDWQFYPQIFIAMIPIAFVTLAEHIGDHSVSSSILNKNFLKDPGLSKTILGDGLATLAAGLLGGPVNTTYSENTGVIILTRVASVSVIRIAAVFAMVLAFVAPVSEFIQSIPTCVMGGISLILFGLIAQNGIRLMQVSKIDINNTRNMILIGTILVLGIGGAGIGASFSGMSFAAVAGIILNLILPEKKN